MAGNDVRIRLSPEGIAEVAAALRKVEREAKRANRESASGLAAIRKQVISIRGAVGGLGLGAATIGLSGLGTGAVRFADQIGEMSSRVGVATEDLSALAVAAKFAGIDGLNVLQSSLARLPQTLDALRSGVPGTERAFADLGLTAQDFDGLNLSQSFELIAQRIATLPAGTDKVRLAVDAFGKSGAQLIPLLDKLGRDGFGGLRRDAEGFGLLISQEFADAAGAVNDRVDEMAFDLQGMSSQFLTGFLPVILRVMDEFDTTLSEQGAEGLRNFGDTAARVLGGVIALFTGVGRAAFNVAQTIFSTAVETARGGFALLTRDLDGFNAAAARLQADVKTNFDDVVETIQNTRDQIAAALSDANDPPAAAGGGGGGEVDLPDPAQIASEAAKREAARIAAIRAGLADEASIRQAQAARQAAADERAYDQGLLSLAAYIERRRQAIRAGLAAEVGSLRAELSAVEGSTAGDAASRATEAASLRAQIAVAEIQAAQELDALDAQRIDRERSAATERLQIEQQILELEGRKADASRLALQLQTEALRQQLVAAGATRSQVDALVARFQRASATRTTFEATLAQAEAAFGALDAARTRVEQDVELGITTQLGGQQRILEIERARLPMLQALAEAALTAARNTGDPAAIEQAEALGLRVREIGVSVELASNSFARFRDQAEQASVNALTDFLDNGITQAKSLKDAFRQLALSVISDLKRIAAQALATSIVRGLSAAFGASGTGGGGGGGGGAGGFALGGLLRGPGTGTSDSIPAWLSTGEYVVRASSVRRPGVLQALEAINSGSARGFARGGLVDVMPRFAEGGLAEAGVAGSFRGRLEVGLADGLSARSTPSSEDFIIDVIRRNPRRIGELIR